jgi:hypothetical protein
MAPVVLWALQSTSGNGVATYGRSSKVRAILFVAGSCAPAMLVTRTVRIAVLKENTAPRMAFMKCQLLM